MNNAYGEWHNEDHLTTGLAQEILLEPMSLEAFKKSGTLTIWTPSQAIEKFREMRSKAPVEHFTTMLPPGLPPSKFVPYAEVFAKEVIPAFA